MLRAGDAGDPRRAPPGLQGAARFPGPGVARTRLRRSGRSERRVLRLRRLLALRCRQRALLPRAPCKVPASRSRRASISGRTSGRAARTTRLHGRHAEARGRRGPVAQAFAVIRSGVGEGSMAAGKWWRARAARALSLDASRTHRAVRWLAGAGIVAGGVWLLSACAAVQTVDYYWQSAAGQFDLVSRARSIHDVIAETDDAGAQDAPHAHPRRCASSRATELGLAGQRQLHALHRPRSPLRHVERVRDARAVAHAAAAGAFRSPAASTIAATSARPRRRTRRRASSPTARTSTSAACPRIRRSATSTTRSCRRSCAGPRRDVARLIFHELAHQLIYVPGDTRVQRVVRERGRGSRPRALARRRAQQRARSRRSSARSASVRCSSALVRDTRARSWRHLREQRDRPRRSASRRPRRSRR